MTFVTLMMEPVSSFETSVIIYQSTHWYSPEDTPVVIFFSDPEWVAEPFKAQWNYMYHLLLQSVTVHFVFMGFVWSSE
jgi:hypothetical protein